MGRSARLRGYAAVHPASILILTPARATPSSIKQFETLLKRAGHTPRAVPHETDLGLAIADAPYDVVIAAFADTRRWKSCCARCRCGPTSCRSCTSPHRRSRRPRRRPITASLQPDVMTKHEALAEIDHLMERRLAALRGAGSEVTR